MDHAWEKEYDETPDKMYHNQLTGKPQHGYDDTSDNNSGGSHNFRGSTSVQDNESNRNEEQSLNDKTRVEGEDVTDKRLAQVASSTAFLKTRDGTFQPKKFNSRCRLFVGNLSNINTDEEFRQIFEPFGEIQETYLNSKEGFGLLKMDTIANACLAKATLDCTIINGKYITVRFAEQCSSVKVKNLSLFVTNELLKYSFNNFGEVERAVVIMDDQGRSTGEGIVTFTSKTAARRALQKCTDNCFVLTGSPLPILVEPHHEKDSEVGFQEKTIPKRATPNYFKERNAKPRFTVPGSWEHEIAMEWKNLFEMYNSKRQTLETEMQSAKLILEEKQQVACIEEKTLVDRLKHLDEEREMLKRQLELRKDKELQVPDMSFGQPNKSFGPPLNKFENVSMHNSMENQGYNRGGVRGRAPMRGNIKRSPMDWRRGGNNKRGRFMS